MSGTLRDQLARELRRKVVFITPQEQEVFLAYEKLADAAIAFIAAWALEPAQVEKATRRACDKDGAKDANHVPCAFPSCLCTALPGVTRAAIAALFEHRKDTMR